MDSTGSILDASIKIVPSEKLIEYICTLDKEIEVPPSISQFIKRVESKKDANEEKIDSENDQNATEELQDSKDVKNKDAFLTVGDIKWLHAYIKKHEHKNSVYLHELFEGSKTLLPENEIIKRNPVLEARCEKLRKNQMNRDYRAMTKNVDNVRVKHPEESISFQVKNLNKQLVAVIQFIVSLGAGFLFGFLGVEMMIGNLDFGFRLLLGVMCALVIALAEIYFLAKKLNEDLNMQETVQLGGPTVYPPSKKVHKD